MLQNADADFVKVLNGKKLLSRNVHINEISVIFLADVVSVRKLTS